MAVWFVGAVAGATLGVFVGVVTSFIYAFAAGGFYIMWEHFARIIMACIAMVLALHLLTFPVTIVGLIGAILIGGTVFTLVLAPFYYRESKEVLASLRS